MNTQYIGLGQAGSRIVDQLSDSTSEMFTYAVDSDDTTLSNVESVPDENRISIGPVTPSNNSTSLAIGPDDRHQIDSSLSQNGSPSNICIVAGIGGQTAALGSLVLTQYLQQTYDCTVIIASVLPDRTEAQSVLGRASETVKELKKEADRVIGFSNTTLSRHYETRNGYSEINSAIANRLTLLMALEDENVRMEGSNTVTTIGYDETEVSTETETPGLIGRLLGKETNDNDVSPEDAPLFVESVTRDASINGDAMTFSPNSATGAVAVIRGPSEFLTSEAIQRAKSMLVKQIGEKVEVTAEVANDSKTLSATVMLTGITKTQTLIDLHKFAEEAPDDFSTIVDSMTDAFAYDDEDINDNPLFKHGEKIPDEKPDSAEK